MSEHNIDFRAALFSASRQQTWWDVATDPTFLHEDSIRAAADLHNSGEIDFVHLYLDHPIETVDRKFLIAQHLFCKVLPLIDGSVSEVIKVVNKLTDLAVGDLAANDPKDAFRNWCSQREDRPRTALELIKSQPCRDFGVLSLVLEAGAKFDLRDYVREAVDFSQSACLTRLSAVTALGRIDLCGNVGLQADALRALKNAHESTEDDVVVANIVSASSSMYSRNRRLLCDGVDYILRKASRNPGPSTQCALADVIREHHARLPSHVLDTVFAALINFDLQHCRVLHMIDFALHEIDLNINQNRIISFLRQCLLHHKGALSIGSFTALVGRLPDHAEFVGRLAWRWFREGDPILCSSVAAIFQNNHTDWSNLNVDFTPSGFREDECTFVCRKIVGYMSALPIVVARFLTSALRNVKTHAANTISNLLFDPVLINLRGEVRAYLVGVAADETDPAARHVRDILKRLDVYMNGLRSVGKLVEMEPPERQRRIANEVRNEMFSAALAESKGDSLVSLIATESTVLFGATAVSYFSGSNQSNPGRNESPFQTQMSSVEWPALSVIDPVATSYRLFEMRNERWSE